MNLINNTELNPCPVCGGDAILDDWTEAWESGTTIKCGSCGTFVCEGVENGNGWHERAVFNWNNDINVQHMPKPCVLCGETPDIVIIGVIGQHATDDGLAITVSYGVCHKDSSCRNFAAGLSEILLGKYGTVLVKHNGYDDAVKQWNSQ